jgi:hypothetical protein
MLTTAARRLNVTAVDCVCVGGLFSEALFKSTFESQCTVQAPLLKLIFPTDAPAWGAVQLAKKLKI